MTNKSNKHWIIVVLLCGILASSIEVCNDAVGIFYTLIYDSLKVLRGTFVMHETLLLLSTAIISLFMPRKIG